MKFSLFLILFLSSILSFAFTALSNPHPFSDGVTPSPVFDADGGRLQAGVDYLVLPVVTGSGGGLSPANIKQKPSCPRDIIQEAGEIPAGFPVRFSPVDTRAGLVPLSTDVNVKFFTSTVCSNETVWRVGKYDEVLKQYFIVTGGVEGKPGPETIGNWFKIEKLESDYKMVFCPSVCSFCQVVCEDVGIFVGTGGTRFLALSDTPLVVKFKRAFPLNPSPFPVSHGPPHGPVSYSPPPAPFPHARPPLPVPEPHWSPRPVPESHGPPSPVPKPHTSPPPVPVPHGPPRPIPEPHGSPPLVPEPQGPPPPVPEPHTSPPPVPVPHGPPRPIPEPHGSPPPVPEPHGQPPPVPEPHEPPPPIPEPHGPPPPVPEPHRPPPPVPVPYGPPPPVPVPTRPPPPDTSLAVATFQSPAYTRLFAIFVSLLFCFFQG